MRRPRFGLVSRSPGGPGQPSAGIMTGCLEWLHVDDDEGAMATAPDEVRIEDSVVARKRGSGGHKTPQVERREAPRARSQGPRRRLRTVSRAASPAAQGASHAPASAGAPLPSEGARCGLWTRACPGPTKERGRWRMPIRRPEVPARSARTRNQYAAASDRKREAMPHMSTAAYGFRVRPLPGPPRNDGLLWIPAMTLAYSSFRGTRAAREPGIHTPQPRKEADVVP